MSILGTKESLNIFEKFDNMEIGVMALMQHTTHKHMIEGGFGSNHYISIPLNQKNKFESYIKANDIKDIWLVDMPEVEKCRISSSTFEIIFKLAQL